MVEETLKRTNEILSLYKGTHNFHNYTSGKKPSDPSARRYITDMKIGSPFVQYGLEFASITVKGQSFMLHQIRKMIGLMIAVIRGLTSISAIEKSWLPVRRDVPKAPGLGLMLEEVHYGSYNKRYSKTHDPIKFDQYKEEIEKFKKEHIYKVMIETEKAEKSMMQWLATLHLHHFGETTSDFPVTAETALGKDMGNLIKAEKSQEDVESETVCGKDESSGQRAHTESDSIPPEKQCDSSQVDVMESLQGSDSPCTDSQRTDNPLCQMKEKDESAKSPLKSNSTNQSQPTVST